MRAPGLANCFAADAVVKDERQSFEGLAAIEHKTEPLAARQTNGGMTVTSRLTGTFPGSPIELQFIFTLEGDRIAYLEIRS